MSVRRRDDLLKPELYPAAIRIAYQARCYIGKLRLSESQNMTPVRATTLMDIRP